MTLKQRFRQIIDKFLIENLPAKVLCLTLALVLHFFYQIWYVKNDTIACMNSTGAKRQTVLQSLTPTLSADHKPQRQMVGCQLQVQSSNDMRYKISEHRKLNFYLLYTTGESARASNSQLDFQNAMENTTFQQQTFIIVAVCIKSPYTKCVVLVTFNIPLYSL